MHDKRRLKFVHIDVFAERPLEGNPLAVYYGVPSGLTAKQMQTIAREMNLSETTFVFRRERKTENSKGIRVRIFTVQEELPFAGHPTLGTAWVLRGNRSEISLDLNVGRIPVKFSERKGKVFGEMTQRNPEWGMKHDIANVASALGVSIDDLDPESPIETVSTGNPFAIVAFRSLSKLKELLPDGAKMSSYLSTTDAKFFYLVCKETINEKADFHARMIFYGGEDPATGSAAGPAAAWMLRHEWIKPEQQVWIEQGVEISRPSQIFVRSGGTPERPMNVRVGGFCHGAIEGELLY
jgi:trans-2,3-dihydro-3-hydroxyanthranilate isomerase